jgi:flavin reductase (DIM6/NTAB) family NADH-FMN oxidoreductase RutF
VAGSDFVALAAALDYQMLVVTAAAGGERDGCLIGFATQSSIHPARFLVCLSRENRTHGIAARARILGVHFVPAAAGALAELFGGETGDEIDKLARCAWRPGPDGVPLLDDCPTRFAGEVVARLDAGDHEAFLLAPVEVWCGSDDDWLTFRRAKGITPGHPA